MSMPQAFASRHRSLPVALLAIASLVTALQPASARHFNRHRHLERHAVETAEVKKLPSGPLYAVVSLADQHVSFYDANGLWARSRVSTGVPGHPTPTGIFTILEKERWHRSNIYSGAPMPFMQRVTWTGVAMHEGVVPRGPASHGCIRLPGDFARRLFGVTNPGLRVIISAEETLPADIMNAHLPTPKLQAPPFEPVEANKPATQDRKSAETVALAAPEASTKVAAGTKLLNPVEFAKALKAGAEAKVSAALQAKKNAAPLLDSKLQEARLAAKEFTIAEDAFRKAQAELDEAIRSAAKAQEEDTAKKAAESKSAAESKLAAADSKLAAAREAKAARDQDIRSLEASIRDADAAATDAAATAKGAIRRLEPVSIFISRKTGRLYVRQATQHLFDIPVTIRDPERPLGTHLLIATRPGEDGASLRWVSLTPPAAVEVKVRPHSSRRGRRIQPEEDSAPISPFPETASQALDRIEIPEEAAQRISELLWAGATFIISDVGMSGEGRFAMDFMVLNRTLVREQ